MDDIFGINTGLPAGSSSAPSLAGQDPLQAMATASQQGPISYGSAPSYISAADSHNLGNGNSSWLDPTTWHPVDTAVHAGYFLTASLASGANSFYNTGAAVANWAGADVQQNDISTQLTSLDSDLGAYYNQHRQAADLVGFMATSLIPGIGAVKVLNAGQKVLSAVKGGSVGTNMARSFGLLSTNAAEYAATAGAEFAQTNATYSLLNSTVQKSILSGFGQAALESAAFEVAVTATMNKAPMLQDQDLGDIVKNVAMGGLVGGVIGGAITGAITRGITKKAIGTADELSKPLVAKTSYPGATPAERVQLAYQDQADMQGYLNAGPSPVPNAIQLAQDKTRSLMNDARSATRELTSGDDILGNMIADANVGADATTVLQNMHGVQDISRMSTLSPTEIQIISANEKLEKYESKVAARGTATGLVQVEPAEAGMRYVKLLGEGTGDILTDKPAILNIADTVKPKAGLFQKVASPESYSEAVQSAVDSYKFKPPGVAQYDPLADTSLTHYKMEARYIFAKNQEIAPGTLIHENDIPMLEQATLKQVPFNIQHTGGYTDMVLPGQDAMQVLEHAKNDLAVGLQDKYKGMSNTEIAKITNVKLSYLEGTVSDNTASDIFATQSAQAEYNAARVAKGLQKASDAPVDTSVLPSYAKVGYSTALTKDVDGNVVTGMAAIKANYNAYQQGINNAVTQVAGDVANRFYHPGDDKLLSLSRNGAAPGDWSFASANYLSPEEWAQQTGAVTHDLDAQLKTSAREILNPVAYKLQNNPETAIRFQAINDKILSTSENYIINDTGTGLINKQMDVYRKRLAAGGNPIEPKIQAGAPIDIPFGSQDVADAVSAHIQVGGDYTGKMRTLQAAQGIANERDPAIFYPMRPSEKDYPFKAFVVDDNITGVGHMSMLHAADADTLQALIDKTRATSPQLKTITRDQSEDWHKAIGDWEYDKSLHDNYIDSTLHRNGVSSPYYQVTDPTKIAEDFINHHMKNQQILTREVVNAKFGKEFDYIRNLADSYAGTATSRAGNAAVIAAESDSKNPMLSYIRTALDINQASAMHPLMTGMQQKLDSIVSKAWNGITGAVQAVQSPEQLDLVNAALNSAGVSTGYRDAATELLANHSAPKGVLNKFVRDANSILGGLLIRTDGMNALNTALGHNILLGAETQHVVNAIKTGRSDLVGALTDLMHTPVPGTGAVGTGAGADMIASPPKLIMNAIKNWFDPTAVAGNGENLKDFYNRIGRSSNIRDQLHSMLGDLAVDGTENASALNNRKNNAFQTMKEMVSGVGDSTTGLQGPNLYEKAIAAGEKFSGNSYVHGFNNFISADVIRQITDLGVKAGVINGGEQLGMIHTFANRVQGNILASQRPLMFQGPVGNAVGLFQSYIFNMLQQTFRYVAEGTAKDAGLALGLQGTLYGASGLPGFNFINDHLIATAAGNRTHQDLMTSTYGALGKQAGDWLMYGAPSNIIGANLYARGHMNPRSVTLIPTNLADIPAVNASVKFFGNLKDATMKVNDGGNVWQTFLQGIEHNGLSRPLAGLAQTLQGLGNGGTAFSTTSKGDIMGANDVFSLATLGRLAGGRPLDEAVAQAEVMRLQSYAASDAAKKDRLVEAIKSTVMTGSSPTPDQMGEFAQQYAAMGGKQQDFARIVVGITKHANTAQANVIASGLTSPKAKSMQLIMGGDKLMDGSSFP